MFSCSRRASCFRLAAFNFLLRRSLGFSKCWCRRKSDRIPAFSHFFLNRRRALSKDSPSLTLMPGKKLHPLESIGSDHVVYLEDQPSNTRRRNGTCSLWLGPLGVKTVARRFSSSG